MVGTLASDILGPSGPLAKTIKGFVARPAQIAYSDQIEEVLKVGGHLVVEGPTGIGKSFGYLVPAIDKSLETGKPALIVTKTIALQEQLIEKDLPILAEALPDKFTFAILKGRSNYLCRQKHGKALMDSDQGDLFKSPESAEHGQAVASWAELTQTGDFSELPFVIDADLVRAFAATQDECRGKLCGLHSQCWATAAKARAARSNIIVANYHMLFTLIRTKSLLLSDLCAVILDEAHECSRVARDFFGFRLTEWAFSRLAKECKKAGAGVSAEAFKLFRAVGDFHNANRMTQEYGKRWRQPPPLDWEALAEATSTLAARCDEEKEEAKASGDKDALADWSSRKRRAETLAGNLRQAFTLSEPGTVYFVEWENNKPAVCGQQVNIGATLRQVFFSVQERVVATSATLSIGGTFDYIASELGLDHYYGFIAESPFKWEDQALLVLPPGMPDPRGGGVGKHRSAVANTLPRIVEQARGRTLALFTSYDGMHEAAAALRAADLPYQVLVQGEMPRMQLVAEFKRDVSSVLLGVESFWEGVDVPGESLSCLVIDKLPFPPPDAVSDYQEEKEGRGAWSKYSLPKAVLRMKQGVGRLIRAINDTGVVVLLDPRLTKMGYGETVLSSLPAMVRSACLDHIGEAIREFDSERELRRTA